MFGGQRKGGRGMALDVIGVGAAVGAFCYLRARPEDFSFARSLLEPILGPAAEPAGEAPPAGGGEPQADPAPPPSPAVPVMPAAPAPAAK